jgi:hypothetical protein
MPRSGTTGVGSALGFAPHSAYLYEPLNPLSGLRTVEDYFLFPGDSTNGVSLEEQLDQVFRVSLRVRNGIWDTDTGLRRVVKHVTGSRTRMSALRCRLDPRVRTVIWKDPFASFLAGTVASEYGVPGLVTVRSPEAAAASFKRLGWDFDVNRIRDRLEELAPGTDFVAQDPAWTRWAGEPATNAALLWRLLYGYLDHTLTDALPVSWVNVHQLIKNPVETYRPLFERLDLPFSDRTRAAIEHTYRDEGTSQPSATKAHDRKRNVQESNSYWSNTLTASEQAAISEITADVRRRVEARVGDLG